MLNYIENKDTITIGAWNVPVTKDKCYRWLKECGIDVLFVTGAEVADPSGQNYNKAVSLCEKYGIGTITHGDFSSCAEFQPHYKENRTFLGLLIKDEPMPSEFGQIRSQIPQFCKDLPGKLFFVNLFPSYVDERELRMGYDDYVDKYCSEVLPEIPSPQILSYDYYPLVYLEGKNYLNETWLRDHERIALAAQRAGCSAHCFIQTMPILESRQRFPCEADIRLQMYVALAYGFRSISHFCYGTPPVNFEFSQDAYAMIDREGHRTPVYYAAKRVNSEIKAVGNALAGFVWRGTIPVSADHKRPNESFSLLKSPLRLEDAAALKSVSADGDALIGLYDGENGKTGLVLVNFSDVTENKTLHLKLIFAEEYSFSYLRRGREYHRQGHSLKVSLPPGEGMFLILSSARPDQGGMNEQ